MRDKSSILVDLELILPRLRKLNVHIPHEIELDKPVSNNDRPGQLTAGNSLPVVVTNQLESERILSLRVRHLQKDRD